MFLIPEQAATKIDEMIFSNKKNGKSHNFVFVTNLSFFLISGLPRPRKTFDAKIGDIIFLCKLNLVSTIALIEGDSSLSYPLNSHFQCIEQKKIAQKRNFCKIVFCSLDWKWLFSQKRRINSDYVRIKNIFVCPKKPDIIPSSIETRMTCGACGPHYGHTTQFRKYTEKFVKRIPVIIPGYRILLSRTFLKIFLIH